MNRPTGIANPLMAVDPDSLRLLDAVIDTSNLPAHGIAVHDPAMAETTAHVPGNGVDAKLESVRKADDNLDYLGFSPHV